MIYLQKKQFETHSLSKIKNQEKPILLYSPNLKRIERKPICVCGAFSSALNR